MKARLNFGLLLNFCLLLVVTACQPWRLFAKGHGEKETTVKDTVEEVKTAYLPGGGASAQASGAFTAPI